jgi:hypothetical protein
VLNGSTDELSFGIVGGDKSNSDTEQKVKPDIMDIADDLEEGW